MLHNYIVDNDPKKELIMGKQYTYHDDDGSKGDYWFMGYSQNNLAWASFTCAVMCENYENAKQRHNFYGDDLGVALDTDTCHNFTSKGN